MAASHLLRLGSVKDVYNKQGKLMQNGLLALLKHHKRAEVPKDNIDPKRSVLNYCLTDVATPASIAAHANSQMLNAGIETKRKNGVMAVEVLFSLPIDRHSQDTRPFFNDCFTWVQKTFAGELLSFDVHLDEAAPHAHALILPLIDGNMQGNKMKGGRGNIKRLQNLFHQEVAQHFGLSRSDYKRYNSADKANVAIAVLNQLQGDSIMKSSVWPWAREAIQADPFPLAQMLAIVSAEPTSKKAKSFVDHKRSHGKGSFTT
jgi:Plasmid recombination enzyme